MTTKIELTSDAAIRQFKKMIEQKKETLVAIRRKKSIRASEKAMWLMDVESDIAALEMAIDAFAIKVEIAV
jgi:hypothetical protein